MFVMAEQHDQNQMKQRYQTMANLCRDLNIALQDLTPLSKKIDLLSGNAANSAVRVGAKGQVLRVLTHEISVWGKEIVEGQRRAEPLVADMQHQSSLLLEQVDDSAPMTEEGIQLFAQLSRLANRLSLELEAITQGVHKGKYLATFLATEAANANQHSGEFMDSAKQLSGSVATLEKISVMQQRLLTDLLEHTDTLRRTLKF